jgi:hypothetical protein
MELKTYTEKSFVIIGEDMDNYKDEIKELGGKWNGRLTNKETGERFGAWLFWSDKRSEIQRWLGRVGEGKPKQSSMPYDDTLKRMDEIVNQCQAKLDEMKRLRTAFIKEQGGDKQKKSQTRFTMNMGRCDNSLPEQPERKHERPQKISPVGGKYTGYCSDDEAPAKPHRRLLR